MADLQELVSNQTITEGWPSDYPHILLDQNERPVVVDVGGVQHSAWLTVDDSGAFNQVTLFDIGQTGLIYQLRPGADRENRLVENAESAWIDRDNPSQSWPGDAYEEVFYNTESGAVVTQQDMINGNASWIENDREGDRPFASVILRTGLADDGVVSEDDLSLGDETLGGSSDRLPQVEELPNRLPDSVSFFESSLRLEQTVDSQVRAEAEPVLFGQMRFATGAIQQIVSAQTAFDQAYPEGSITAEQREMLWSQYRQTGSQFSYDSRDAAQADGLEFSPIATSVDMEAANTVADDIIRQQTEGYAEVYGDNSQPVVTDTPDWGAIADQVQERANAQPEGERDDTITIREQQTDAGAPIVIPNMPDIPAPDTVLISPADRAAYVEQVLGQFEQQISSNNPNASDGIGEMDEALAALRQQLPNMIDADRLRAEFDLQLNNMSPEDRQAFEASGGVDNAIKSLQQELVALSTSQALNPDLEMAAQDALDQIRGDIPAMANQAFDESLADLNATLINRFQDAQNRADAAGATVNQAVENLDETKVQALMDTFRSYRSLPNWEQIRDAYSQQNDPALTEALRRLDEEQGAAVGGAQPALPGVNR